VKNVVLYAEKEKSWLFVKIQNTNKNKDKYIKNNIIKEIFYG